MQFDGTQILRFVHAVRGARGLWPLTGISFVGAEPAHEDRCVIALATGLPVGGSDLERWDARFVLRCGDPFLAARISAATGQPRNSLAEVALPDELERLAVLFDEGACEESDLRYLDPGQLNFVRRPSIVADRVQRNAVVCRRAA